MIANTEILISLIFKPPEITIMAVYLDKLTICTDKFLDGDYNAKHLCGTATSSTQLAYF